LSLVRPLAALRPAPGRAADVIAPPYDVVTTDEARARVAGRPWSFLHVSKPEIDLPAGADPHSPRAYAKAAENLARMLHSGILVRDAAPAYYVYRVASGNHVQTGVVTATSIGAYEANRVRKHEHTRPDKEDDRVRHMQALNAQTGPVLVAYPRAPEIDALLADAARGAPDTDARLEDGVRHSIWPIRDAARIARVTALLDDVPALYIADGHHRSAAAARVAAARRTAHARSAGEESHEWFLTVAFPHHELRILDYNRVVRDLAGMSLEAFLARLREKFTVAASGATVRPARHGEFGLYAGGRWHRLTLRSDLAAVADPARHLDVSLLTDHVLVPILGIGDLRTDQRVDFVGGGRGLAELERRVDSGAMAAAFSLYPTRMEDLMAIADAGEVMPPKSTWFDPKLADGLVSHVLD
jgi:uncharacterized protein (DUF1015 family)